MTAGRMNDRYGNQLGRMARRRQPKELAGYK
jgi:hypothetical protein